MSQPVDPDAHPDGLPPGLPSSYHWQGPVVIASIVMVAFVVLLARGQVPGWLTVALIAVVMWAAYVTLVRLRTRAYLRFEGPRLVTRRYRQVHVLEADQISAVREYMTGRGPSFVLHNSGGSPVHVPTAWLRTGQSSFFGWLLTYAPTVDLDKGARRTLDRLVERGLVDGSGSGPSGRDSGRDEGTGPGSDASNR